MLVGVGEYAEGGFGGVNLHIYYVLRYFRNLENNKNNENLKVESFHLPRDLLRKIFTGLLFITRKGISMYPFFRKNMLSKYDIIHSHGSILANSIAIKLQKYDRKFIITLHGYPSKSHVNEVHSKDPIHWKVFWRNYYEILLSQTQQADCVITVAEWIKKKLKKELDIDAIVIPNMIDPKDVQFLAKNHKSILDNFDLKDKEYIVWLGARVYPVNYKRPQDFIELAKRFPDELFVMVGKGIDEIGLKKHLNLRKNEIPKNIKLINTSGFENSREIFLSVLKGAKFSILTSFEEAFGYVILESLSLGVPVIVPDSGGPPEIVIKKVGDVYTVKDVDDLELKVNLMLDQFRNYDSEILSNYVRQRFYYKDICNRLYLLYTKEV